VAAANRCVDHVRRRVQNELLGHRGRKDDPLYKIRRVLLTGSERLNQRGVDRMALGLRLGDPDDEVLGAWLAKEYLRDVYLTEDPNEAAVLLDRVIAGCLADEVDEVVSLGNTLASILQLGPKREPKYSLGSTGTTRPGFIARSTSVRRSSTKSTSHSTHS
jgi:hypothetical protein